MHQLVSTLRWRSPEREVVVGAVNRRIEITACAVIEQLRRLPAERASKSLTDMALLSDGRLRRFLGAPSVFEACGTGAVERLAAMLDVEAAVERDVSPTAPGWTAIGDRWVGATGGAPAGGAAGVQAIECSFAVDRSLPELLQNPTAGLRSTVPLAAEQLLAWAGCIDRAVAYLDALEPSASHLVSSLTANVVLRRDDERPDDVRGASSPIAIGRTVVVNAPAGDEHSLAEVLVHEAIHALLSIVELDSPFVARGADAVVQSPWTGNRLPLRALLHACFVWFALHGLRAVASDTGAARPTEDLARGFSRLDLTELETARVDPTCLAAIDEMREEVLRT